MTSPPLPLDLRTDDGAAPDLTVAAIIHDGDRTIDELLVTLARRLEARGLRLAGIVQHNHAAAESRCAEMVAEDLARPRRVLISAPRGPGDGCRLDTAGLAEVAALAGASLAGTSLADTSLAGVDEATGPAALPALAIFNKFGRQEAEGSGLRAEMAEAITRNVPLLTAVARPLLGDWYAFLGAAWHELPPDIEAVEAWCLAAARSHPPGALPQAG